MNMQELLAFKSATDAEAALMQLPEGELTKLHVALDESFSAIRQRKMLIRDILVKQQKAAFDAAKEGGAKIEMIKGA